MLFWRKEYTNIAYDVNRNICTCNWNNSDRSIVKWVLNLQIL